MSTCFVIMPITTPPELVSKYGSDADHFKHVLDHLLAPAIEKAGHEVVRPSAEGAELIHASIIKKLEESDLVLCDMSGLNANVFFELGIRTAVNKPACIVVDDLNASSVPFDTGILNYHTYRSALEPWHLDEEIDSLATHIQTSANGGEQNALWSYFGLSARAAFTAGESGLDAKVDLLHLKLDALSKPVLPGVATHTFRDSASDPIAVRTAFQLLFDAMDIKPRHLQVSGEFVIIQTRAPLSRSVEQELRRLAKRYDKELIFTLYDPPPEP